MDGGVNGVIRLVREWSERGREEGREEGGMDGDTPVDGSGRLNTRIPGSRFFGHARFGASKGNATTLLFIVAFFCSVC